MSVAVPPLEVRVGAGLRVGEARRVGNRGDEKTPLKDVSVTPAMVTVCPASNPGADRVVTVHARWRRAKSAKYLEVTSADGDGTRRRGRPG